MTWWSTCTWRIAPKPPPTSSSALATAAHPRAAHTSSSAALPPRRLCKIKYFNNCLFYNVQRNFIVQSGDPTNTGKGGESIWGVLYGEQARPLRRARRPPAAERLCFAGAQARLFEDEIRPHLRHKKRGVLGMAGVWLLARLTCPACDVVPDFCMPCMQARAST